MQTVFRSGVRNHWIEQVAQKSNTPAARKVAHIVQRDEANLLVQTVFRSGVRLHWIEQVAQKSNIECSEKIAHLVERDARNPVVCSAYRWVQAYQHLNLFQP